MKHVLLAVTGMSPQVVTETLYGIARRGEPWPDELHIITTRKGEAAVCEGLFTQGHLRALCEQLAVLPLSRDNVRILVIPDAHGQPVDDARTEADHEALADFIMETVRRLTSEPGTAVHASIAGGRKTMTFYLGYAMSLFGRAQDRMSHVLVSDGFEGLPEFYFPTTADKSIYTGDGRELNARDAEVSLADIPFIRQRDQLPDLVCSPERSISFRKLIDLINLGNRPEDIHITLHEAEMHLDIQDGERLLESLTFTRRLDFTWYLLVAEATRDNDGSYRRPFDDDDLAIDLGWRLLERLAPVLNVTLDHEVGIDEQVDRLFKHHEQALELAGVKPSSLRAALRRGFEDVNQPANRIKDMLEDALPDALAKCLKLQQLFDREGQRKQQPIKQGGYAVNLQPHQIHIVSL